MGTCMPLILHVQYMSCQFFAGVHAHTICDLLSTYMYQYVPNTHILWEGSYHDIKCCTHNYDKNHFISPLDANLVSLAHHMVAMVLPD